MDQKKPAPSAPQPPAHPSTPAPVVAAPAPSPVKPSADYSELLKQAVDAVKQVGNEIAAGLNQLSKTLEQLKSAIPTQSTNPAVHAATRAPRIDDAPDSPKF